MHYFCSKNLKKNTFRVFEQKKSCFKGLDFQSGHLFRDGESISFFTWVIPNASQVIIQPTQQAAEGCREWRIMGGTLDDIVAGFVVVVVAATTAQLVGPLSVVAVTRSQRGHMDRADVGSGGSQLWAEITAAGPTFMALSSSTSFCSRRFCSVRDPYHLFMYSHSISVCFSLLLQYLIFKK